MRRFWALTEKELREHWLAMLFLFLFVFGMFLLNFVAAILQESSVSTLEIHRSFVSFYCTLTAFYLGHRLIVVEFYGRTQLFLESLPLRRWEILLTKYLIGLKVLLLISTVSLALTAWYASRTEPVEWAFVQLLVARTVLFLHCVWSFCFLMGLLGRLRVPIYILIVLVTSSLTQFTEFQLGHFGPFVLVDSQMCFERLVWPRSAMFVTLCLSMFMTILAFVLGTIKEGSLTEVLSQSMSQKEKTAAGVIVLSGLAMFGYFEERKTKDPFAFASDSALVQSGANEAPIAILYMDETVKPDAEVLCRELIRLLGDFAVAMGKKAEDLPKLHLAYRSTLDGATYEKAQLKNTHGLLIRANFRRRRAWRRDKFLAYVLEQLIAFQTKDRAYFEPKRWLLDGFCHWFVEIREPAKRRLSELRAVYLLKSESLTRAQLRSWEQARERCGPEMAEAWATVGFHVMDKSYGRDRVLSLARSVFAREASKDIREFIYESRHPLPVLVEQALGVSLDELILAWRAGLEKLKGRAEIERELAQVGDSKVTLRVSSEDLQAFRFRVEFSEALKDTVTLQLLHDDIGPFDWPFKRRDLRVEEWSVAAGRTDFECQLRGRYGSGSRVFLCFEQDCEVLRCPRRLFVKRISLP